MNKQQLFRYLLNPFLKNLNDKNQIENLLIKYPYFQTLHLLYVKSLSEDEDPSFRNKMNVSSFVITNKKRLREILSMKMNSQVKNEFENQFYVDDSLPDKIAVDDFKHTNDNISIEEAVTMSNTDNQDVVSDTLAKIYELQGNSAKAVKIYEQLKKIHPEKSSMYDDEIKRLKKID